MHHLKVVATRLLYRQAEAAGVKEGFYTFDLIEEVVADPRIADADLDLIAYKNSIGPDSWSSLLRRYAHDEE